MTDGGDAHDDPTIALAAAAHEIKNALGPLAMTLQLVERQVLNDRPVAREDLAFARGQVRRLSALVADLMDQARVELGTLPIVPCPTDLDALVAEAVDLFRRAHPDANVTVAGDGAPLLAAVDAARMHQVLANLLENAARYAPAGSPIAVSVGRAGLGVARIEVRDRGPGLSADEQSRVFERFVRGVASEGTSGLGLGLYLCRAIVERHGGRIGCASAPGAGATFWMEIQAP